MTLREFPEKSQQEIAEQVGCAQSWVSGIKKDIISSDNIPPTRTDSLGRTRPTRWGVVRSMYRLLKMIIQLVVISPLPYISRAARDLNRAGSAMCAKLSFSFEKIEA
jgi:hypothetical protein